jgi:hypothetical protein
MQTIEQILEQDTEPLPDGQAGRTLKDGVAPDRRVSIEDPEMRHGRKSKRNLFSGYKEHLLSDLDSQVIREVVVRPANEPEFHAIDYIQEEVQKGEGLGEFYIDLGYAAHEKIQQWIQEGVNVVVRPWAEQARGLFGKSEFTLDFKNKTVTCPAGVQIELRLGKQVYFPVSQCDACPLRSQCTTAKPGGATGRSLRIREDEEFQAARRAAMKTPQGRAELRQRSAIEHRISHQVAQRGRKARYLGTRKNQYDGRRHAAVLNLQLADRYYEQAQESAKAA